MQDCNPQNGETSTTWWERDMQLESLRAGYCLVLVASFMGIACQPDRVDTRSVISGNVVLTDVDGLNDMSRVRVDVGRGEGGTAPDGDGSFVFEDLEPDEYFLRITYAGALLPEASGSAYQAYEVRVPARKGGNTHLGNLELKLATGAVVGSVHTTDGTPADGAEVALMDHLGSVRQALVTDGAYRIENVPVGKHTLRVSMSGYEVSSAQNYCRPSIIVAAGDVEAEAAPMLLAQTVPAILPGFDQVGEIDGNTWILSGETVSIRVDSAFASQGRVWREGEDPPEWLPFQPDGYSLTGLSSGVTHAYIQLRNQCGYETEIFELVLVRDVTPPDVTELNILGLTQDLLGRKWVARPQAAVDAVIVARDDWSSVDGISLHHDIDNTEGDIGNITFQPVSSLGNAVNTILPVLLSEGEGEKLIVVRAKDRAGNISEPKRARVYVDYTPPQILGFRIAGGKTRINDPAPSVQLDVADDGSGVTGMQTSLTGDFVGLPGPFLSSFPVSIVPPDDDGQRLIHVRIYDGAGNTVTQSQSIVLDRKSPQASLWVDGGVSSFREAREVNIRISHEFDTELVGLGLGEDSCGGQAPTAKDAISESWRSVMLDGSDGVRTVRACVIDRAGNQTLLGTSLFLDTTPPSGTLLLNGGARITTDPVVNLLMSTTEAVLMRIGETVSSELPSPEEACAGEEGYFPFRPRETEVLGADGHRIVWVCLRDIAGNTSMLWDEIVLDTTPPELVGLTIGDGNALGLDGVTRINTMTPAVRIDGSDATYMKLSATSLDDVPWLPFAKTSLIFIQPPDGMKTVRVKLMDDAGLQSPTLETSVELLTRGSVQGYAALEGGGDLTQLEALLVGTSWLTGVQENGFFELTNVPEGSHVLRIRAGELMADPVQNVDRLISVRAGESVNVGQLTVKRAQGDLGGRVTLEDEISFAGILVELIGSNRTTTTNSDGYFEFPGIVAGVYRLRIFRANYEPIELDEIQVVRDQLSLVPEQNMVLAKAFVRGNVFLQDAEALGIGHEGVTVSIFGNDESTESQTQADGSFATGGIRPGFYSVKAVHEGYRSHRENGVYLTGGIVNDIGDIVLERPSGRLLGHVTAEGRESAIGARVSIINTPYVSGVDAVGQFEFRVPVGTYEGVEVTLPYYEDARVLQPLVVTEEAGFTVPSIALQSTSGTYGGIVTLSGKSDGDHGGIEIQLEGISGTRTEGLLMRATSDASGSFSFEGPDGFEIIQSADFDVADGEFAFAGIPYGEYLAVFAPPEAETERGRETQAKRISIGKGARVEHEVSLRFLYLVINEYADGTNDSLVRVAIGASDCSRMRFRLDTVFQDAPSIDDPSWLPCASQHEIDLGTTQGRRIVFGQIMNSAGAILPTVSDDIILDTTASILTFSAVIQNNDGSQAEYQDNVDLVAVTGEPGGQLVVEWHGYDSHIVLTEGGDLCSGRGAGCYATTYALTHRTDVVPVPATATQGPGIISATFLDAYGNEAKKRAHYPVGVGIPPLISNIEIVPRPSTETATIHFQTDEEATGRIRWGPTPVSLCHESCPTTTLGTQHEIQLVGLERNQQYVVVIEATDPFGNVAMTGDRTFLLRPDPPQRVVAIPGDHRVLVRWESPAQTELSGYQIERSADGGLTWENIGGDTPYQHEALIYVDKSVQNGAAYAYRISSIDIFGNKSVPAGMADWMTEDQRDTGESASCLSVTPLSTSGSSLGTEVTSGLLPFCSVWTEHGSPYRVMGNIGIPEGGVLVVGPNVDIKMAADVQVVVRGRIAMYGNRGEFFDLSNSDVPGWENTFSTNGFPDEDTRGMVDIDILEPGTTWQGITVRNASTLGLGRVALGQGGQGDIFYRTALRGCGAVCIDTDSVFHMMRSTYSGSSGLHRGPTSTFKGVKMEGEGQFHWGEGKASTLIALDSDFVAGEIGGIEYEDLLFDGSNVRTGQNWYDDRYRLWVYDSDVWAYAGYSDEITALRSRAWLRNKTDRFQKSKVKLIGGSATVLAPAIASAYGSRITSLTNQWFPDEMFSSRVTGLVFVNSPGTVSMEANRLLSANCVIDSRFGAAFPFGETYEMTGIGFDCNSSVGPNLEAVHDFYDDVTLGEVKPVTSSSWLDHVPEIRGPVWIHKESLRRGIHLSARAHGAQELGAAPLAFSWNDASGNLLSADDVFQLPENTTVGAHRFWVRLENESEEWARLPWDAEVFESELFSPDFTWPTSSRWRVSTLKLKQLPFRNGSAPRVSFQWECFSESCEAKCTLDDSAPFACKSPFTVAGLSEGTHSWSVQPTGSSGEVLDLPQRYSWSVGASTHEVETHLATNNVNEQVLMVTHSGDWEDAVWTCASDERAEETCEGGYPISGEERVVEVRAREKRTGALLQHVDFFRVNDIEDSDGDGWVDANDPCLNGPWLADDGSCVP